MDLRQIRSFLAVYEDGSINRAAERLRLAQPSLSQQIRVLEESLEVALFERHARGVRPTPAGVRFHEHCRKILGDVEHAAQTMREFAQGDAGSLNVGLIPTVTKGVLAQVLPKFIADMPGIDVRVVEAFSGTLTDWVMSGALDFAIVTEPRRHDGLELRVLSQEPLVLVSGAGAGLDHLVPVAFPSLPPLKLVIPSAHHSLRAMIERYIKMGNITVSRQVEIDGLFGSLEFVRNSDFSAIFPVTTVMADLDSGAFVINPIVAPQTSFDYFLVHQTERPPSRAGRELVARLEAALRHSAAAWAAIRAGAPGVAA